MLAIRVPVSTSRVDAFSSVEKRPPPLFTLGEDSQLKGFVFAALIAGIATGFVLEYRLMDPFGSYLDMEVSTRTKDRSRRRLAPVVQTSVVAFMATMLTLVLLYRGFSFGNSMVSA